MHQIYIEFAATHGKHLVVMGDEGDILLEILLRHHVNIRHDCGGVCSCATCHVFIESGMNAFENSPRREIHFLKKAVGVTAASRLSCQCVLKAGKHPVHIIIPDQQVIPGVLNSINA